MSELEAGLLFVGGLVAGVVNTLAGAGSLLTVPTLVLFGLPGTLANGTNRIGVLVQNLVASWRFHAAGVVRFGDALAVFVPTALGAAFGAVLISRIADESFERLYGLLMLLVLVPTLRAPSSKSRPPLSPLTSSTLFFAIGLYGGAFQVGVGIPLTLALARRGHDLVRANAIKSAVIALYTAVAVPVFVLAGQVVWLPALVLAAGFALGGAIGARAAVRGGEKLIRPVLALAVLALAGRMLGLY